MEPNTTQPEPIFDLPTPEVGVDKSASAPEVSSLPPAELKGMQAELPQTSPPRPGQNNPLTNPILQGLPQTNSPSLGVASNPAPASQAIISPVIADDVDLIEKEWVLRAKDIVDKTRHDPYEQNKEINKFKAEYIKKRYNKDLRLSDE